MAVIFKDRIDAGNKLANLLKSFKGKENVVICGIPRGGVVLAAEVAEHLLAPLKVIVAKKIGYPGNPEYAIGAVTSNGEPVLNEFEADMVQENWLKNEIRKVREIALSRAEKYGEFSNLDLISDKSSVIIVDDGIATGYTVMASVEEVKKHNPREIIVAVPVIPVENAEKLERDGVEVVAINREKAYKGAVGAYYYNFGQTEDQEVENILSNFKSN